MSLSPRHDVWKLHWVAVEEIGNLRGLEEDTAVTHLVTLSMARGYHHILYVDNIRKSVFSGYNLGYDVP
jgi:hypothetical protein